MKDIDKHFIRERLPRFLAAAKENGEYQEAKFKARLMALEVMVSALSENTEMGTIFNEWCANFAGHQRPFVNTDVIELAEEIAAMAHRGEFTPAASSEISDVLQGIVNSTKQPGALLQNLRDVWREALRVRAEVTVSSLPFDPDLFMEKVRAETARRNNALSAADDLGVPLDDLRSFLAGTPRVPLDEEPKNEQQQ